MELTNILGRLKSDELPPQPFLAIELTDNYFRLATWDNQAGQTHLLNSTQPQPWTNQSDLLSLLDKAIVNLIDDTSTKIKVIFGLPYTWLKGDLITPEKLKLLKAISQQLNLQPLGFVTLIDSLLRYLKMQEGVPSTSLLIHLTGDEVILHYVLHGKIQTSISVTQSDDLAKDVAEALTQLQPTTNLPSRMILFDGSHNLDELTQNLTSYDWQTNFNFLHFPKIEHLSPDILIKSLVLAGGAEIAKTLQPTPTQYNNFGFSEVSENEIKPKSKPHPKPKPKPKLKPKLPTIKPPKLKLPQLHLPKLSLLTPLLIVVVLSIIGSLLWFVPSATVTLQVVTKTLTETIPLTLSTQVTQVDIEKSLVPATFSVESQTGSASAPATGTKTIGDPATGTVTIYNRTNLPKTFPKGTLIQANGLKFSLDQDVTVASSSSGSDYTNIPGKAEVKVTAKAIGSDSNLPANTEFTVDDYSKSTYVARNQTAFSGGTTNIINVISQSDYDSLVKDLTQQLLEQLKTNLNQNLSRDEGIYLLQDTLKIDDNSTSDLVGKEASTLELTLAISVKAIHYRTTDVEQLVSEQINQSIPQDYIRTADLPIVTLHSAELENDTDITAEAEVKIKVIPRLNPDNYRQQLKGLSNSQLKLKLDQLVKVSYLDSIGVSIFPQFIPPYLKRMPYNSKRIQILIKPTNHTN